MNIRVMGFKFTMALKKTSRVSMVTTEVTVPFAVAAIKEVKNPKRKVRPSTIANEQTAVRAFVSFYGKQSTLKDITAECIEDFERHLAKKGICPNTSACYMRSLRAVINRMGGHGKELFAHVSTSKKRTGKKAVSSEVMKRIEQLDIKDNTKLAYARDTLLLSFYAMGMPFIDMVGLTTANIHDDHIIYHRHKTGEKVCVPLTPSLRTLIDKYRCKDNKYLLPFLQPRNNTYQQYHIVLDRQNRWLHQLSEQYGLPKLTTYTSRHTWATLANRNHVDIQVIAKALGHTNPMTTLNYINDIDYDGVDTACQVVLDSLYHHAETA